jgi:hypothetical protein
VARSNAFFAHSSFLAFEQSCDSTGGHLDLLLQIHNQCGLRGVTVALVLPSQVGAALFVEDLLTRDGVGTFLSLLVPVDEFPSRAPAVSSANGVGHRA